MKKNIFASLILALTMNTVNAQLFGGQIKSNSAKCFAPTSDGGILVFMCHNLGADETADPFTPSWRLNGAYIQWGKRGPTSSWQTAGNNVSLGFIAAPTGPNADQTNEGSFSGWSSTTVAANGAWNVNEASPLKTSNDPCPNGFRIPTRNEWVSIYSTSPINTQGNWNRIGDIFTSSPTNYSSGVKVGNNLYLPFAGHRSFVNGILIERGISASYISSTESGTGVNCLSLLVTNNLVLTNAVFPNHIRHRLGAFTVRCVKG